MVEVVSSEMEQLDVRLTLDTKSFASALDSVDRLVGRFSKDASVALRGMTREMTVVRTEAVTMARALRSSIDTQQAAVPFVAANVPNAQGLPVAEASQASGGGLRAEAQRLEDLLKRVELALDILGDIDDIAGIEDDQSVIDALKFLSELTGKSITEVIKAIAEGSLRGIVEALQFDLQQQLRSTVEALKSAKEDVARRRRELEERLGRSLEGIDFGDPAAVEELIKDLEKRGFNVGPLLRDLRNRQQQLGATLEELPKLVESFRQRIEALQKKLQRFLDMDDEARGEEKTQQEDDRDCPEVLTVSLVSAAATLDGGLGSESV